jgi:hypothetical protein
LRGKKFCDRFLSRRQRGPQYNSPVRRFHFSAVVLDLDPNREVVGHLIREFVAVEESDCSPQDRRYDIDGFLLT